MANRKPWTQLSDNTKKRYRANGITPAKHKAGASLTKARGHTNTPEHGGVKITTNSITRSAKTYGLLAIDSGIAEAITGFTQLPIREQNRLGKLWLHSFFNKGTGEKLNAEERIERGLHSSDTRVYRHAGDEQISGRQQFMYEAEELAKQKGKGWNEKTYWIQYRAQYLSFNS